MRYQLNVILSKDQDGYYAFCPELPGCHSQGDNFEDAQNNIREAIELYLETMTSEEIAEVLPRTIITTQMEVQVA